MTREDVIDGALAEVGLEKRVSNNEMVERLAALAHDSWTGWFIWMAEKWYETHASGELFVDRWRRQAATPYADLSEAEKESDRVEARKVLALLDEWMTQV